MFSEDVENQLGTIDHSRVDDLFDVALLRCGKVVVKQQKIRRYRRGRTSDLFQFSPSDESCRVRLVAALQKFSCNLCAGTSRKRTQLVERFLRAEFWNCRGLRDGSRNAGAIASSQRAAGQRTLAGFPSGCRTRACAVVKADQESSFHRAACCSRNEERMRATFLALRSFRSSTFQSATLHFVTQWKFCSAGQPRWARLRKGSPRELRALRPSSSRPLSLLLSFGARCTGRRFRLHCGTRRWNHGWSLTMAMCGSAHGDRRDGVLEDQLFLI